MLNEFNRMNTIGIEWFQSAIVPSSSPLPVSPDGEESSYAAGVDTNSGQVESDG